MVLCGAVLVIILICGIGKFWKRRIFLLLLAGSLLCTAAAVWKDLHKTEEELTSLSKNEVGEGSREKEVIARTADEEVRVTLTIPERQYTNEEAQEILREEKKALSARMLGENGSFSEVRYDLVLPDTGENPLVSISWYSSDPSAVSWEGALGSEIPEEGIEVTLRAVLKLQEEEEDFRQTMTVYPKALSGNLKEDLADAAEQENSDAQAETYVLPKELQGEAVAWYEAPENTASVMAVLILLAGMFLLVSERKKEEEARKKRQAALQRDYPELISRLLLMLYAGGTVRKAFFRIAAGYQKEKKEGRGGCREAFEEVSTACREMETGVGEAQAYENLAERCALPAYRTLAVLLTQNYRRGGAGVLESLEQEVLTAFAQKRREARMAGDAATIKLLLPLGLMLMIVFALLMIPAFLSL